MIRVGLKTGDLIGLDHSRVTVTSDAPNILASVAGDKLKLGSKAVFEARSGRLVLASGEGATPLPAAAKVELHAEGEHHVLRMASSATATSGAKPQETYIGVLELTALDNHVRAVLITDLENYVRGVLQSEVPASFDLEALKAQAVLARTYGLHPRLPHDADGFNVCDSYLHCQAFYGVRPLSAAQSKAINETRDQILTYSGKPALALFSACAGGHTESYQYCFSDPVTGAFPPPPIPYLTGVAEGKLPPGYPSEAALRKLFAEPSPDTDDAWSAGNFRWRLQFTANQLESHMHHVVAQLRHDPQFAAFIHPPSGGQFGHIKSFQAAGRGEAGTIVELIVATTGGEWRIEKELTIRSIFAVPELKLKRLKSARIFFDHSYDKLGLLATLTVSGFGSGHGVGLQQIGAQGLAKRGLRYRQIIEHYYPGTAVGQAP